MVDPLSVAASVCGIVSLGVGACKALVEFYDSYSKQDETVLKTVRSCQGLIGMLELLDASLKDQSFKPGDEDMVLKVEESILACEESIDELQAELKKFDREGLKKHARKIWYPLKESTLLKLREHIEETRDNVTFAVSCLGLKTQVTISQDIQDLTSLLASLNTDTVQSDIITWLNAPDPTINLNIALERRHKKSGSWLLQSTELKQWESRSSSVLWVNGFAGCGKTVLCSVVVQQALLEKQATAFYFFDFRDVKKQTAHGMMRSLLLQLAGQSPRALLLLEDLWRCHRLGEPTTEVMLSTLRDIIAEFKDVRIFFDALDEIPRGEGRNFTLRMLKKIHQWKLSQLHLFMTSRAEQDIREGLALSDDEVFTIQNERVDEDIGEYVRDRLRSDRKLEKWSSDFSRIEQTLIAGANGMFRWAECQLEAILSCRTRKKLNEALTCLPKTLDETYDRILGAIDEDSIKEARQLLTWLCFSQRPLNLLQLAEAMAISFNEIPEYDENDRILNPMDILDICPGFIVVDLDKESPMSSEPRIAHFSVKEYIISTRIGSDFHMNARVANTILAKCCVSYLLYWNSIENIDDPVSQSSMTMLYDEFSWEDLRPLQRWVSKFGRHAASEWSNYCRLVEDDNVLWRMVADLATAPGIPLRALQWYHHGYYSEGIMRSHHRGVSPAFQPADSLLFYGAYWGLTYIITSAIKQGSEINSSGIHYDHLGTYVYPYRLSVLGAASFGGQLEAVQLLLQHGADPNYVPTGGPSALSMACRGYQRGYISDYRYSHIDIIRSLLESGADIKNLGQMPPDFYPTSLLNIAIDRGSLEMAKLLISYGSSVQGVNTGSMRQPLHYAASRQDLEAIRFLCQNGAVREARDKNGSTPYSLAVEQPFVGPDMENQLKELHYPGAVNDVDNKGRSPLHKAAERKQTEGYHKGLIDALLAKGADKTLRDNNGRVPLLHALEYSEYNLDSLKPLAYPSAMAESGMDGRNAVHIILDAMASNSRSNPDSCKSLLWLLEEGCPTDLRDRSGYLPCHYAAKGPDIPFLRILMDHERKTPTSSNIDPAVGLLTAYSRVSEYVSWGHINGEAVTCLSLIEQNVDVDVDLLAANLTGDSPAADLGIRQWEDKPWEHRWPYEEPYDQSVPSREGSLYKLLWCIGLRAAARRGHWDIVRSLKSEHEYDAVHVVLDAAAFYGLQLDDVESIFGPQPPRAELVFSAASHGHLNMLKSLEERGAALDSRDSDGENALSLAVAGGYADVARFLDNKVSFEPSSKCVDRGLIKAIWSCNIEILEFISSHNFDMRKILFSTSYGLQDKEPSWTALHFATRIKEIESVEALLRLGHPVDALDVDNSTPLAMACDLGSIEIVKSLLDNGAQTCPHTDGMAPLWAACEKSHLEIVKILVERGADLKRQYSGRTILEACDTWVEEANRYEFDKNYNKEGRQAIAQYLHACVVSL